MGSPQQQIDGYLGTGWYEEWKKMDQQAENEERRFSIYKTRLNLSIISDLYDRIRNDLDIMDSVKEDYDSGLELLGQGRRIDKEQIGTVHDLYTLALGTAENENDVLEAMWAVGLAGAFVVFPFVLLEARAQELMAVLPELQKQLHEAEKEARNAKLKTTVHGVITIFEIIVPEISLLGRAGIYLGEVVVNKALGPRDPTTFQKYEGDVTPGVKQFSEAVHHVDEFGHDCGYAIAKKTGPGASWPIFYFDVEEISDSSERAEKLKELLEKVKNAYEKLHNVLGGKQTQDRPLLKAFEMWVRAIERYRTNAVANVRDAESGIW